MNDEDDASGMAAEYVLGTLSADERSEAIARLRSDPAFLHLVTEWEGHFAPLLEASAELSPPSHLFDRVLSQLPAAFISNDQQVFMLRRGLVRWRAATAVVTALAALLAFWIGVGLFRAPSTAQTYMAVLQQGTGTPAILVSVDVGHRLMTIVPAGAPTAVDKSYELWRIDPGAAPKSLGVMDLRGTERRTIDTDQASMTQATYAVTLEPLGGAPNGQPTSAPIFVGHLIDTRS